MGRDKQAVNFRNKLIVSCQDNAHWTLRMAIKGGCGGLRLNGPTDVKIARLVNRDIPIIACWKIKASGYGIYITPTVDQIKPLVDAGADIIAFDATSRKRPVPVCVMSETIHNCGALSMADVHYAKEGISAAAAGADFIATTLNPNLEGVLLHQLSEGTSATIVEEGGIRTPEEAKLAIEYGADLVVVGTAITRPQEITRKFVEALK